MAARPDAAAADLRAAADWIVRLSADTEAERAAAREGFDAWVQADAAHAKVAAEVQAMVDGLRTVREQSGGVAARRALDAGRAGSGRSRALLRGLVLLCALSLPLWWAAQVWPPAWMMADLRTGTGLWLTRELADGTRITLNTSSAVNVRYDPQRRLIELVQGEILVDVARDAGRAFVVQTAQGQIQALGTRFVVRRDGDTTELSMLESKVTVRTADDIKAGRAATRVVSANQQVRITAQEIGPAQPIDGVSIAAAWAGHQLAVHDRPLPEVLAELARHRPGLLHFDAQALAGVRVTAVLPLDDTDRALRLLQRNFPQLRLRTLGPYLVWVSQAGED